jgi:hypothetical protein
VDVVCDAAEKKPIDACDKHFYSNESTEKKTQRIGFEEMKR